ncbi:MAG TPA: N-acetylmuramoyl-L-alanine amidase [Candidatus Angelobacter sp.]|nr:N-acetylmuramoyl-L-alanine amidase [Candidatus Angelobacter sp.]
MALAAMLGSALVSSAGARTVKQKKQAARTQFETAERMREALDGKPESKRTRSDYQKVMDAYRKVYYTAPNSDKSDAAVLAVAELLDDQGRVLNDPKSYKDAIGQLAFLRREYPGSKYRVEALFTIAEIYRDDLNDNAQAKAAFEDYLKHYPHSSLAPKAKQAVTEIGDTEVGGNPFKRKHSSAKAGAQKTKAAWAGITTAKSPDEPAAEPAKNAAASKPAQEKPQPADTQDAADVAVKDTAAATSQEPVNAAMGGKADTQATHRMARLTSVRHWSTPDYTRVAIDLEQEVQYQAGRVPHPDRIFFDLYDTRLASDLVGKSFDVEAGFLHRIRVAQYKNGVARVVLDVDDVAEYSAFLLPNPYRLIIDIHGKLPPQKMAAVQPEMKVTPAKSKDPEPASDVTVTQVKPPANSKPAESAAVAQQPDKIAAKASNVATQPARPAESQAASKPATEKTVEVAKADPPKTIVDDTTIDNPSKLSSKPTTGPTFQAIAPQESSRNKSKRKAAEPAKPANSAHAAAPTANGDRSLIRALGLKIGKIVVDAGHGGHDTGTIGPNGLMEKDLVLDVALKLGKLLEDRLGAEVVYTRDDDTFVPLETRTAIANKEQADMFISIHANSSDDASARGVETYYLNFTSSRDALEVAARENAVSEKSIHELQDLVKKIALKEKIEESREFAADVQRSLYVGLNARNPGIRNRGVKKAPFIVLIGANMPSILAEISFVSNPGDERKLKTSEYRQRIAESLYKGVNKYVSGLSGVKTASKLQDRGNSAGASAVAAR